MLTFCFLLDIMSSSKQRNNKHTTKFKEGGTDHREQNELSHNLRKEGTDHQKLKLTFPQLLSEVQDKWNWILPYQEL